MAIIDRSTKITSRLPIQPVQTEDKKNWKHEGLCPVTLLSVELTDQTDETGEFMGVTRKVLNITFTNYKGANTAEPDRFTTLSEKAVGQKKDENGVLVLRAEADVIANNTEMYKRIAHILENCQSSPTYRPFSSISDKDWDKYFDLPALVQTGTPAEQVAARIASYDKFFEFIAKWFNGDGVKTKPIHLKENGEPFIHGWLKLLPAYPKRNYYSIPSWVQTGFFEAAAIDPTTKGLRKAVILQIKPSENLYLASASNAPSSPAGANQAGMPISGEVTPAMQQFLAAQNQQ